MGYAVTDLKGSVLLANDTFIKSAKLDKTDIPGLDILELIADKEKYFKHTEKTIKNNKNFSQNITFLVKGKEINYKIFSNLVEKNGKKNIESIFYDYSIERMCELKLKEMNEEKIFKTQFLGNIVHELRTPTNTIVGFLTLLSNTELDEQQQDYLSKVLNATDRFLLTSESLLTMSDIELNVLKLHNEPFNLKNLLFITADFFKKNLFSKDIAIDLFISPNTPEEVIGDPARLRQVFGNIFGNAVKFTHKGNISIKVDSYEDIKGRVKVKFEVSDTGIGINGKDREKIFLPFKQADVQHSRQFSGLGLGLTVCKRIIENMDGEIDIKSKEAEGTTVTFTVKLEKNSNENQPRTIENTKIPSEPLSSESFKILLAEDEKMHAMFMSEFFEQNGYDFDIAENGLEVIEKFRKNQYSLILMDCQMPYMDGYEATRIIRRLESNMASHTPIIATTASITANEQLRCKEEGMDSFISKPVDFKELEEVINKYKR